MSGFEGQSSLVMVFGFLRGLTGPRGLYKQQYCAPLGQSFL